jgi:hypothetical protein
LGKYLLIARMGRLQWRISFSVVWDDDLEPVQKSRALGLYLFGRWIHFAHTLIYFQYPTPLLRMWYREIGTILRMTTERK